MEVPLANRVGIQDIFRAMYDLCARCLMRVKVAVFQAFGGSNCILALS